METALSADGREISVLFKEYAADFFERTGTLSLHKLMSMIDIIRYRTLGFNDYPGYTTRYQDNKRLAFIRAMEMKVYPALRTSLQWQSHLKSTTTIFDIGPSSTSYLDVIRLPENGEVVCECASLTVDLDGDTGEPVEIPSSDVKKIQPYLMKEPTRFMSPLIDRPTEVQYTYTLLAPPSDAGVGDQIDQTNFIKYCLDNAALGAENQAFSLFDRDVAFYPVNTISMFFFSRAFIGDQLTVMSWEDQVKPNILYFVVQKDTDELCHAVVAFQVSQAKL